MTINLPKTGNPAIVNFPIRKRNVRPATAPLIDDEFLLANPECQMFVRPAFPGEIPLAQPGEAWVVAFRRDSRGYIRLAAGETSDRQLTREQIAATLLELCVLKCPRGDKTSGETLEAAGCVIVDAKGLVR
jgi:hypothetical protein